MLRHASDFGGILSDVRAFQPRNDSDIRKWKVEMFVVLLDRILQLLGQSTGHGWVFLLGNSSREF